MLGRMLVTSDSKVRITIETARNIKYLYKCLLNFVIGNVSVHKTKLEGYEK